MRRVTNLAKNNNQQSFAQDLCGPLRTDPITRDLCNVSSLSDASVDPTNGA
jgi:hypothetical protein